MAHPDTLPLHFRGNMVILYVSKSIIIIWQYYVPIITVLGEKKNVLKRNTSSVQGPNSRYYVSLLFLWINES